LLPFLLVDCCVWLTGTLWWWLHCQAQLLSLNSLSLLHFYLSWLLILTEIGPYLSALFSQVPTSSKVDCCMFAADLGKTAGNRWDFMQVLCKKWKNIMNSPFLTIKEPHFLPPSWEIEGVRDQSWQGQKWPCSSYRIARIRTCRKYESTILREGELSGCSFPCRSYLIVMSARLWGERRLSGIKKEWYLLSYGESLSRLACDHGRSVLFLMYVSCDFFTHKISPRPKT